jgi:hypothetical protein
MRCSRGAVVARQIVCVFTVWIILLAPEAFAQLTAGFSQMKTPFSRGANMSDFVVADQFLIGSPFLASAVSILVHNEQPNAGNTLLNFSGVVSWRIQKDDGNDYPGEVVANGSSTGIQPIVTGQSFAVTGGSFAGLYSVFRLQITIPPLALAHGKYWLVFREGDWGTVSDGSVLRTVNNLGTVYVLSGLKAASNVSSVSPDYTITAFSNVRFQVLGSYLYTPSSQGSIWVENSLPGTKLAVFIPTTSTPLIWKAGSDLSALESVGTPFAGEGEVSVMVAPAGSQMYFFQVMPAN